MIVILITFTIFLLISIIYSNLENSNYNNNNNNKGLKYYKCSKLPISSIHQDCLNRLGLFRSNSKKNWDMFLPCGYNTVEKQLEKIGSYLQNAKNNQSTKLIFGIDSSDLIVSKPNLWLILEKAYGRVGASRLIPESFVIYSELDSFKKQYKTGDVYILKNWRQRKLGLKLSNNYNQIVNTSSNDFQIIQKYLKNPYLINNRKINLRIYLLIVSYKNNLHFLVNRNLKCIYTQNEFDINDIETKERHFTSLNLDSNIFNSLPYNREDLISYWGKEKYDILFSRIIVNLKRVCYAIRPYLCRNKYLRPNINFQLFGLDYIVDSSFNPWLLEFNKGPDMSQTYQKAIDINTKVINQTYGLVFGLLANKVNLGDYILIL